MSRDLKATLTKLRADPRTIRLQALFSESPVFHLPLERLQSEIEAFHATRSVRRLNPAEGKFVDSIIRAVATEISTRARLAEINLECSRGITTLKNALKSLTQHLMIAYQADLRSYPTKEERARVLDMALRKFNRYIEDVEIVRESALIVIADIDKASYGIKVIADLLRPSSGGRETSI